MRVIQIMIVFALFFMVTVYGWTFDDGQNQKTITGTVSEVDWVKSMITVRYFTPYSGNADEITIIVSDGTKIMNGTDTESFSNINQADRITVTYYDDGVSGLKAKRITELNSGNK